MFNKDDLNYKDDVFMVVFLENQDDNKECVTFVRGERELAHLLTHYDTDKYEFVSAEQFCPGDTLCWDYKELLLKKGN